MKRRPVYPPTTAMAMKRLNTIGARIKKLRIEIERLTKEAILVTMLAMRTDFPMKPKRTRRQK